MSKFKLKKMVKGFEILTKYHPEINFVINTVYGSIDFDSLTNTSLENISAEDFKALRKLNFRLQKSGDNKSYFSLSGEK